MVSSLCVNETDSKAPALQPLVPPQTVCAQFCINAVQSLGRFYGAVILALSLRGFVHTVLTVTCMLLISMDSMDVVGWKLGTGRAGVIPCPT